MPETVRILENNGIVEITSFGTVTQEDLSKSRQLTSKIYNEQQLTKALVHATAVTFFSSIASTFDHCDSLANSPI